jgi:hypothetical protein
MRSTGAGQLVVSVVSTVMGLERMGSVVQLLIKEQPEKGRILLEKVKSFKTAER